MRLPASFRFVALCACVALFGAPASARAANYDFVGAVIFTNIQGGLGAGEDVPYYGTGVSALTGLNVQTGSIRPTAAPTPVGPTTLQFTGVVGAHPLIPFGPKIHVVSTGEGSLVCTWEATFTIELLPNGNGIFSGDGNFTVLSGTGKYKNATGTFRTLFATGPIPLTTDTAGALVAQKGKIKLK